ncbi:hypothetical protein HanRHA438_Chr00c16g0850631 [Helianthus annuus]|nr:hypothetical protein HanRHA438_Chr00c16g0850631 [Helianthus annuus]
MNPFRPPFGVTSRPGNPNTYRPNTTQPQPSFNIEDMDPNVFAYAQVLASGVSQPFFQVPQTFPTMGGSQPSTQDTDPEIETVPETQPEPVVEGSKRGKRSHKKKDPTDARRKGNYQAWTKDEEYALARVWLVILEAPDQIIKHYRFFGKTFVKRSLKLWGKMNIEIKILFRANGPISTRNVIIFKRSSNALRTTGEAAKTMVIL